MTVKEPNRIDDILNGIAAAPAPQEEKEAPNQGELESPALEEVQQDQSEGEENSEEEQVSEKPREAAKANSKESEPVVETDDYGLEVPKPRMYSEEEVQRMMRERLARGNHNQPPAQQAAVQQAAQDFKVDPENEDSWQAQLDAHIDQRLAAKQSQAQQQEFQRKEQEVQANFEARFTTGMQKHDKFTEVVGKLPITNSMMMALRGHENPATFLMAAATFHPDEVKRIASLPDPLQQAAAIGQLDERMKKAKGISRAAAPLKPTTGDMPTKYVRTHSIDDKIQSHAKQKIVRR